MKYNLTQDTIELISRIVGYQCNKESASNILDSSFVEITVDEARELKDNLYVFTELHTDKTYHLLYKYNDSCIHDYSNIDAIGAKLLTTYTYII